MRVWWWTREETIWDDDMTNILKLENAVQTNHVSRLSLLSGQDILEVCAEVRSAEGGEHFESTPHNFLLLYLATITAQSGIGIVGMVDHVGFYL